MDVQTVINEQAKRLKILDSADFYTRNSAWEYTRKKIKGSGFIPQGNYLQMKEGIKVSTCFAKMIVDSIGFSINSNDAKLFTIKTIVGNLANRQAGIKRRGSKSIKAKTFELSRSGEAALKKLKKSEKKSYSLIIEELLLDSDNLFKHLKSKISSSEEILSQQKVIIEELNKINCDLTEQVKQLKQQQIEVIDPEFR